MNTLKRFQSTEEKNKDSYWSIRICIWFVIPAGNPDVNLSMRISNTMLGFPSGMTNRVLNFCKSHFILHGCKERPSGSLINCLEARLSGLL